MWVVKGGNFSPKIAPILAKKPPIFWGKFGTKKCPKIFGENVGKILAKLPKDWGLEKFGVVQKVFL